MTDLHDTMTYQKMIDREALTICDLPRRGAGRQMEPAE